MRTSSGPAVKSTAHKGRTHDRNLLRFDPLKKTLAKLEPSTNDSDGKQVFDDQKSAKDR